MAYRSLVWLLLPVVIAACRVTMRAADPVPPTYPPPPYPAPPAPSMPMADGFDARLAAGCVTVEQCRELLAAAEARRSRCMSLPRASEGHRACMASTTVDATRASDMLARARREKRAADESARAATIAEQQSERRARSEDAAQDRQQRLQERLAERKDEQAKSEAELDAAASGEPGYRAFSAVLCWRSREVERLEAEQRDMRRLDAASGTVDMAERRELMAALLAARDGTACYRREIPKFYGKPPLKCDGLILSPLEEEIAEHRKLGCK